MNNQNSKYIPQPNPITQARHKRQLRLQILLPVLLGALAVIAVAVFASMASNPQVARWGNISTIFLVLPLGIALLGAAVLLFVLVYGLAKLLKILPAYAHLAQMSVSHYSQVIQRMADRIVQPVLSINGTIASAKALRNRLRR